MPIIKNQFGGRATVRLTASNTYNLYDFSLPYDTQSGTVAVTGANVVGTNTTFDTKFSNGSYVYVTVNSTYGEARPINQVVNSTFMNVTTNWTAANAATTFSKAETISALEVSSAIFTSNGTWSVYRGANNLLNLVGTQVFDFYQRGLSLREDGAATLVMNLSASSTGTLILDVSKRVSTSNNQTTIG